MNNNVYQNKLYFKYVLYVGLPVKATFIQVYRLGKLPGSAVALLRPGERRTVFALVLIMSILLPHVLAPPGVALHGRRLEERGGFEPPRPVPRPNGFQDRRIRPLCHLSDKLYFNVTTINCLKTYWPLKNWSYFVSNYEGLACHT